MKKYLILICTFMIIKSAYSYNYLRVGDPRNSWNNYQGTIEEAIVSMRPNGLFMECGLYLTFSAKGTYYTNQDTLEVSLYFDLPEEAIVHDSWLWIGDDIIRAEIMDKWTAASIYEGIVSRRKDPSILYKRSATQYELRIFPMPGEETRKVKITYLMLCDWTSKSVYTKFPTELLNTSRYKIQKLYVLTWLNEKWKNPKIVEFPETEFNYFGSDSIFGEYYRADIFYESVSSSLYFSLDAPFDDHGVYIAQYEKEGEGLYQLSLLPTKFLEVSKQIIKTAFLFDYNSSKSTITSEDVISDVKTHLHSTFSEKDSFNLIFSKLNINRVSDTWLPADSITIENTFSSLGDEPLSNYSNLPSLLVDGVDFINNNGRDGNIVLIANSDQVGDYKVANQLIEDVCELMNPLIPIHIVDYLTQNYMYYYIGGRYYYGNEYFYMNISRKTAGNYNRTLWAQSIFSDILLKTIQSLSGYITSSDLYTTLSDGVCYGRYNLQSNSQTYYLNQPILQIGKFSGSFPFQIDFTGKIDNQIFNEKYETDSFQSQENDSLLEEIWYGNYIRLLEQEEQSNNIINEIVTVSTEKRILSIYSAFLCLEPNRGGNICYDCLDESELVAVMEDSTTANNTDSVFVAYPNPFNSRTNIRFFVNPKAKYNNTKFLIYNLKGQIVKEFSLPNDHNGILKFIWDGTNNAGSNVAAGNYFFVISTPNKTYTKKLTYMK